MPLVCLSFLQNIFHAAVSTFSSVSLISRHAEVRNDLEGRFNRAFGRALRCAQTLLVAQLDGSLDEGVQLFVLLEEAVLELAGLFWAHPKDL